MAHLISSCKSFCLLFLFCLVAPTLAGVSFDKLPHTLDVSASPKPGQVLRAGEDTITVTWKLNKSIPDAAAYKDVKVRLCYAPVSQADRGWRKTNDDLSKDKTCQFKITLKPYKSADTVDYTVGREIPTATYFVRAYVLDADGNELGFGQTTDGKKMSNLFQIVGITGRHASLDIAAACFSAFSVVSLAVFFVVEKRKAAKARK